MKYIKQYESVWHDSRIVFDEVDDVWLEEFNLIKRNSKEYYYKSENSNFEMIIQKYYDKDTYRKYVITIIDDNGITKKDAGDLNELRKLIKYHIPKIDIDAKKYNL